MRKNVYCVLREADEPPVWSSNVAKSVFAQCENIPIVASHRGAVTGHAGSSLIKHLRHFLVLCCNSTFKWQ